MAAASLRVQPPGRRPALPANQPTRGGLQQGPSGGSKTTKTTPTVGSAKSATLFLFLILLIQLLDCQARAKTIEVLSINAIEEKSQLANASTFATTTTSGQLEEFKPTSTEQPLDRSSKFTELFSKLRQAFSSSPNEASVKPETTSPTSSESPEFHSEKDCHGEPECESAAEPTACNSMDCSDLLAGHEKEGGQLSDVERLVKLQGYIQEGVKERLKSATRSSLELFEKLSLSGGCSASLMNLMSSMMQIKSYAFKFVDASAKIPSGVMYGLLSDFGDFDQCLAIRTTPGVALEDEAEEGSYSGKYCLLSVKLNYKIKLDNESAVPEGIQADGVLWDELIRNYWTSNSTKGFQLGVCLPSRCTDDDIGQIYRQMASEYNFSGQIITCQDGLDLKRQHQPDLVQRLIIYVLYLLLALILLGTIVDRCGAGALVSPEVLGDEPSNQNWLSKTLACLLDLELLACFSLARSWRVFMLANRNYRGSQPWDNLTPSDSESRSSLSQIEHKSASNVTTSAASPQNNHNTIKSDASKETLEESEQTNRLCRELSIRIQNADSARSSGYLLSSLSVQTEVDSAGHCLSHLSGLKLLVILWITSGHSFLYPSANNYQYYRSIINMNITRNSVWFATTNFTLGIDMLLYMTGLVFVYKLAHLTHRKSAHEASHAASELKINTNNSRWLHNFSLILRFISKKILRFWPTYLTLIALAILVPLFADGPMWPEMISNRIGRSCRRNWWTNLLFLNNYFLAESEICLPSSWFISVLMQLFLIGSIIVLIVRKYSLKLGLLVIGMLLISSVNVIFSMVYLKGLQAPVIRMDETFVMEMDENIFKMYTSLLNNLGPFLTGMLGGFLLIYQQVSIKNNQLLSLRARFSRPTRDQTNGTEAEPEKRPFERAIGLACELFVALLVLAIAIAVLSSVFYDKYSRLTAAIYWSCHRIGWAIVTGYIIHQCALNKWRLLKEILSLSTFVPLSKLIFIAYLIHPILIHIHSGLVRDGLHVSIYNMMNIYITRLFMTFALALLIHLLVELPLCSMEEILLQRWLKRSKEAQSRNEASSPSIKKFLPLLIVAPSSAKQFDGFRKCVGNNNLQIARGDSSAELLAKSKSTEDAGSRELICVEASRKMGVHFAEDEDKKPPEASKQT